MSRPMFALVVIAVAVISLLAMWLGWRARARRDANITTSQVSPVGQLIAEFTRVLYISTTPVGEPLTRVAVAGLRYRGHADVQVRTDGVTIEVDGEEPVHLLLEQLRGASTASRRVGKAVEHGGLALIIWQPTGDASGELESSFRFNEKAEQRKFTQALEQALAGGQSHPQPTNMTEASQEGEK